MSCADTLTSVPLNCVNQVFDSANCSVGNIPTGKTMNIPVPNTTFNIKIANNLLDLSEVPKMNWGEFKTILNKVIIDNATLCAAGVTGNISDIVMNIKKLQTTEQALINELDSYTSKSGGYIATDPIIIGLVQKINAVADARISMFKTISRNANILQTGVSQSRIDLVSQMTLLQVVEDQLNAAKEKIRKLNNKNDTQMRLVEINTYYGQRYEAQTNLMKKIIMVCIPVLILYILKKKGILPETIGNYVIGIVIAIGSIFIVSSVWDIFTRSNMDFNSYDWEYEQPEGQIPSIWEYNKANFLNLFGFKNLIKNLMVNLGVCIGEDCCAPGLVYDNNKMKCVVPPKAQAFTTMNNQLQGTVISSSFNDNVIGVAPFSYEMAFESLE
jgi:hypothetical protein